MGCTQLQSIQISEIPIEIKEYLKNIIEEGIINFHNEIELKKYENGGVFDGRLQGE